ncbi:MAG: hypothetical protein J7K84_06340 [Deltaproteobacteria bacterium]|nr:hypothetical protein [Deltaproteobacteria bacterium]
MKKSSRILLIIGLLVFVMGALIPVNSFAADVDVYAEGAYTETGFAVYIYADINGPNILSAGVKLTYDTSELTVTSAEKNESVWFLGGESYMDPDISTPGEVVFILGKLDNADPAAGVSGERVLLGKAVFTRNTTNAPSVTLSLGRTTGTYNNFVATDATVLDGSVNFIAATVVQRGDANADGVITFADMSKVRAMITNNEFTIYADCNIDGVITFADMSCIRGKI